MKNKTMKWKLGLYRGAGVTFRMKGFHVLGLGYGKRVHCSLGGLNVRVESSLT